MYSDNVCDLIGRNFINMDNNRKYIMNNFIRSISEFIFTHEYGLNEYTDNLSNYMMINESVENEYENLIRKLFINRLDDKQYMLCYYNTTNRSFYWKCGQKYTTSSDMDDLS